MATHHDEQASENGDPTEHGEEISPSFTTLLLPFGVLIGVTFSTPTGDTAQNPSGEVDERKSDFSTTASSVQLPKCRRSSAFWQSSHCKSPRRCTTTKC